mmetsp:Transcript_19279/g.24874  ORF Transcript_19279/g.24874 Transcript_19279/m.24874 type:complete len:319 (-) Transcript_19279:294-1250(-)|eukprot:CAMPEP_0198145552 /NCGR_PEP_ID=MMETSP1443-20131203/24280_1 /TAXON_ID=186043 /ORGANISM="Entomoneis sp., Strain CCMP2396" /LENGTH=318 /DNA_ID=CAMNT_0043809239 /DNA_START=195 /DNA_END=1151 /DNA_ORIENTATION=-
MSSKSTTSTRKRPAEMPAMRPSSQHQHQLHRVAKKPATDADSARPSSAASGVAPSSSSKPYKGLRHFSMMVCKKVEEKGVTSYNEVADELVQQVVSERSKEDTSTKFDEKNIRRRVYDALNVLMAMDIITKEKKAISWKGLPTNAHADLDMLRREKEYRMQEVERKREALRELLVQQVCFRNLVAMNYGRGNSQVAHPVQPPTGKGDHKIPLPFIVVNTHTSAVIQCNMSRDLTDVMFDFSQPFEINDDNTILKRLGMDKTNRETLHEMLPEDLVAYADSHGMLTSVLEPTPASAAKPAPVLAATSDYASSRVASSYM